MGVEMLCLGPIRRQRASAEAEQFYYFTSGPVHGPMGPGPLAHGTGRTGSWNRALGPMGPGPWAHGTGPMGPPLFDWHLAPIVLVGTRPWAKAIDRSGATTFKGFGHSYF